MIEENLVILNNIEELKDVLKIVNYRIRIWFNEFRKFFFKVYVKMLIFCFKLINGEYFYEMIGFLKIFVLILYENGNKMKL